MNDIVQNVPRQPPKFQMNDLAYDPYYRPPALRTEVPNFVDIDILKAVAYATRTRGWHAETLVIGTSGRLVSNTNIKDLHFLYGLRRCHIGTHKLTFSKQYLAMLGGFYGSK